MGIALSPFSRGSFISVPVSLVDMRDTKVKRIFWVRVAQQKTNLREDLTKSQGWTPIVVQHIKADETFGTDVGVVYLSGEDTLRASERVIFRELDFKEEHPSFINGVLRAKDSCSEVEDVIVIRRPSCAVRRGVSTHVL